MQSKYTYCMHVHAIRCLYSLGTYSCMGVYIRNTFVGSYSGWIYSQGAYFVRVPIIPILCTVSRLSTWPTISRQGPPPFFNMCKQPGVTKFTRFETVTWCSAIYITYNVQDKKTFPTKCKKMCRDHYAKKEFKQGAGIAVCNKGRDDGI